MWINPNVSLVLSDLYGYDISACHYNILKGIGWDMSNIPMEDKKTRNIQIGILQNRVPLLKPYLKNMVENIMDYYISINNLTPMDIITRQKDGMIVTKILKECSKSLPLEFREHILKLVISIDRKKYLKINSTGVVECLGVANKPMNLEFLKMFSNLDFSNKRRLALGLEMIREKILSSKNKTWFVKEKDASSVIVPLIGNETIQLSKLSLGHIDVEEIDKEQTWKTVMWPFVESILLYCK